MASSQALENLYGDLAPVVEGSVDEDFVPSEAVRVSVAAASNLPDGEDFANERVSQPQSELRSSRIVPVSEAAEAQDEEVGEEPEDQVQTERAVEAADEGEDAVEDDEETAPVTSRNAAAQKLDDLYGGIRISEAGARPGAESAVESEVWTTESGAQSQSLSQQPGARPSRQSGTGESGAQLSQQSAARLSQQSGARLSQQSGARLSQQSGAQLTQQSRPSQRSGTQSEVRQTEVSARRHSASVVNEAPERLSQQSGVAGSEAPGRVSVGPRASKASTTFNDEQVKEIIDAKQQTGCRLSAAVLDDGVAMEALPPVTYGSVSCQKCAQKISGSYLAVEGMNFHKACFTCTDCSDRIEGTYFKSAGEAFKCRLCFQRNAPSCSICKRIVHEKLTRVGDKVFHLDCFRCSMCMSGIVGNFFNEPDGSVMCESCAVSATPECGICHSPIFGQAVKAEDQEFHPECFKCIGCQKSLGGGKYYNKDGTRLCETCNTGNSVTEPCPMCGEKVVENYISAEGKKYHTKCFKCACCQESLGNQTYFKAGGKSMCEPCYRRECPVMVCTVCNGRITGEFVGAKDKHYHKDCFRCIFCIRHIAGGFHSTDEGPVCPECK